MTTTHTRKSQERAATLAAVIARHSAAYSNVIGRIVPHMQRLARQAVNIEVNCCTVPDYPREQRMERLRKRANKLAPELGEGFKLSLGGDPRGCCAYLTIPGADPDGWDRERGFPVY